MAKKTNYQTSSDFDISADLDIPDFDFSEEKRKDDRKPITKFTSGFKEGVKSEIVNPGNVRKFVEKALPKSYGDTYKFADETVSSVKDVYSEAVKELKPAIKDIKRSTKRIIPSVEGFLPKRLTEMLRKWSQEEEEFGKNFSKEKAREQSLSMDLAQIFREQAVDQDRRTEDQEKKDEVKEGIAQIRHNAQMQGMDGIQSGIDRLVTYQDKILANYQRKSLELQYRHYFATADILELQREQAKITKEQLDDIKKNTGLPEFVKATTSEEFKKTLKNKFFGSMTDSLFGGVGDYAKRFAGNIIGNAKQKIFETIDSVKLAASGADMATSMLDMTDGIDAKELAGNIAGGVAASGLIGKGFSKVGNYLKKNEKVMKTSEKLAYGLKNSENVVSDYLNDPSKSWGPLEGLREFLAASAPGVRADTQLQAHAMMKMDDPHPYTSAANKSIVEIIPGFLARIHR
jgi:hypothetical protein